MITIRNFKRGDWPAIWKFVEPVFRVGETYAFSPAISEQETRKYWIEIPTITFVAIDADDEILGTYYIKPNQPALGAHVCNCGYIVSEHARGKGVASRMCEHSQEAARRLGFRAMQFNLVVATNEDAVRLWQKLGFNIVGKLPGAFKHPRYGFC
jgi:GNAT superfamily N-acetyltransferase